MSTPPPGQPRDQAFAVEDCRDADEELPYRFYAEGAAVAHRHGLGRRPLPLRPALSAQGGRKSPHE